jgi:hypothetical protein
VSVGVAASTGTESRSGSVSIAGSTFTVSQEGVKQVEVTGEVNSLAGDCPSLTFQVGDQAVTTGPETSFTAGNCTHLRNGTRVHIVGTPESDGSVAATSVAFLKGRG